MATAVEPSLLTTAEEGEGKRTVRRFTWTIVPREVLQTLLLAEYESQNRDDRYSDHIAELRGLTEVGLAVQANLVFGRPPQRPFAEKHSRLLVEQWVPRASNADLERLVTAVQASLPAPDRTAIVRTRASRIAFLQRRNHTSNFVTNLHKHFISAHKEASLVSVTPTTRHEPSGPIHLSGAGSAMPHQLYSHQRDAHAALDGLMSRNRANRRGIVVLPTGAGKTDTAVAWLVPRLAANPQLRVLWLSHRQELLEQAAVRFTRWAPTMPPGEERIARVVHSQAAPRDVLGSDTLDVAIVSFASLCNGWGLQQRKLLDAFFARPTIVVVDEAHHAGAESYRKPLEYAQKKVPGAMIGLTATPNPVGAAARKRVCALLGKPIVNAPVEDLVARGILARPVVHTINTGEAFELDLDEKNQAVNVDLPPSVLRRVARLERNRLIVETIASEMDHWGKSLVFAANVDHAERLTDMLRRQVDPTSVRAIHSQMDGHRNTTINWFRSSSGPAVLVSVGMLTEGVDLPDAQTAFLARPTTSHILMRQMIGRILRGPRSGGTAEGHVVYFQDEWNNFADVLEPAEAVAYPAPPRTGRPGRERELPPIYSDDDTEIPADVAAVVERMYRSAAAVAAGRAKHTRAIDPTLVTAKLAGYYRLPERCVPVFDHQHNAFDVLIEAAVDGALQGRPPMSFFDDTFPPYPTERSLRDLIVAVREDETPEWVPLEATVGPEVAADRIVDESPITEQRRGQILQKHYQQSLVRAAYPTQALFEEAVERVLRRRREIAEQDVPPGLDAEEAVSSAPHKRARPSYDRKLGPIYKRVVARAPELLPSHVRVRLGYEPEVKWTTRVVSTTLAHWSLTLRGRNAGRQVIRVNRLLRTTREVVSDGMLEYLIWHEFLHHLLPGQGHDAEFRELEARWPNSVEFDAQFATFHERWQTKPEAYDPE